jgi:hypothetical protein
LLALERYKTDEAIRHFERAVQIDSTFALALSEISKFYHAGIALRNRELAVLYAEKAWALRARLGVKDRMLLEAWRFELELRK